MNTRPIFRLLHPLSILAVIVVNALANALPINGQNTGDIAQQFNSYFLPAGYVFSIWGLIYIALIAFAYFQFRPDQQDNPRLYRADLPFLLTNIANITWLLLWHYNQFVLSMIAILGLLLSLILVYQAFEIGRRKSPTGVENWLAHRPFKLYLGWASVATIANAASVLIYLGWDRWGLSDIHWTWIMLGVGAFLGALMAFLRRDSIFNLVLAWAFFGNGIRYSDTRQVALSSFFAAGLGMFFAFLAQRLPKKE